jgi:hypothetical protein
VQLHRAREKIGAPVVFIGMGTPRHAAWFRRRQKIDATVLADEERASYRAAGAKRGTWIQVTGATAMAKGVVRAAKGLEVQGLPVGDVRQLGGAMVFGSGGEVLWSRMAANASDNVTATELAAALDGRS